MLHCKKIVVVMPAYNASKTLEMTYREIPHDIVDEVILVDDASRDDTAINFRRSVKYGFGVLSTSVKFFLTRSGVMKSFLFRR